MIKRVLIFATMMVFCANAFADNAKHVLVIHSYHQGLAWTDHITDGIQSVFDPFKQDIQLHFEYLDSLRRTGDDYFQELADLYRLKMQDTAFDAIIASGDEALRFIRRQDLRPTPETPVLFCGVNQHLAVLSETSEIGIAAQLDHQATLSLMLAQHPACRRILVLLDDTFTGNGAAAELDKALIPIRRQVTIEFLPVRDPAGLPAKLVALDAQELIYLLVGDPLESEGADIVPLVMRWSPVAVYSSLDYAFGKGIVGGMITSGFNQGELSARLALRSLSGQPVQYASTALPDPNQYMFDGRMLRRFQIKESRLPAGSKVIHPLPTLWVRHGFVLLAIAAVLALINGCLFLRLIQQKKRQVSLSQTNTELDGRFRERSAHLQLVNQKLKKQALIDDMTGLPNRRYVYQRFVEEAKKAQRYSQPLAILLVNVDGYKQINDNHGYVVAERVLRDVGQLIKRNVREIDLLGRYGGESFLMILPNTDQGRCAADRIRKAVMTLQWEQGEQKVTLSGGLAQLDSHTPAELISIAEKRLDLAKSQGGNRIVAAEADDEAGKA